MKDKSTKKLQTPLLDKITLPKDIRKLDESQLEDLAAELRQEVIEVVSITGGHLGAGLGVIELTLALHYIFSTPEDRLIFDVGHQTYPHKILTGRRDRIRTLRQAGGLSGFTKRSESPYDPFGAAHSSTSISAGLGMAVARDLKNEEHHIISVIGDGAMSAGMAYEAMNNAGFLDSRMIVILNDNDMSIAPPVGAMSAYLSRLISSSSFLSARNAAIKLADQIGLGKILNRAEEHTRGFVTGGTLFEELGFYYIGPLDGHRMNHLLPVLKNIKKMRQKKPILLHVVTQKGKGYPPAETAKDKFHGVSKFDIVSGAQKKEKSNIPSYTSVFSESLIEEARHDDRIVAVSAAMPSGTGLDKFAEHYPKRFFDTGIAEQHAVTFAAGLACENMKPVTAIYSTFLQRAYDQIVHDVAIQSLPVRFAIDRAGLVGADGATHAGSFDLTYLCCLPNFVVMVPADEAELRHMVTTALAIEDRPSAFRYPRGQGRGLDLPAKGQILDIGKGRVMREGNHVAFLTLGPRLYEALEAAKILASYGYKATVADARFAKPVDAKLVQELIRNHPLLISVEEASIGGFSAQITEIISNTENHTLKRYLPLHLPDYFIDQNTQKAQYDEAGLNADQIASRTLQVLSALHNKNLKRA